MVRIIRHTIVEITERAQHPVEFVEWLDQLGYLNLQGQHCANCPYGILKPEYSSSGKDHVHMRCPRCTSTRTVRTGSFFEGKTASLYQIMVALAMLDAEETVEYITANTHLHRNTITAWRKETFRLIAQSLRYDPLDFELHDHGIFEADETVFKHMRSNAGPIIDDVWVAGWCCRETQEMYMWILPSRTIPNLIPPIIQGLPGHTLLCTDELPAYHQLDQLFIHRTVNHSAGEYERTEEVPGYGEVDIHTNTMESEWRRLKRRLQFTGTKTVAYLRHYLNEIMFHRAGRSIFDTIVIHDLV